MAEKLKKRYSIYESDAHPWHLGKLELDHQGWKCAVFVVHGMGDPDVAETAAILRSGFDDALDALAGLPDRKKISPPLPEITDANYPPPYIRDGFWANYTNVKESFPKAWDSFSKEAQKFFERLWGLRLMSALGTVLWFWKQIARLLTPRGSGKKWRDVFSWILYLPIQLSAPIILLGLLIRYPKILVSYLADVRLYLAPKGVTERAIVQQIDRCVAEKFMQMLGMDIEFKTLPEDKQMLVVQHRPNFERIIWAAHSLGTVVSYNALSDLFHKANKIEEDFQTLNDPKLKEQFDNVIKFRERLKRFVTFGSPLDKVAHIFGDQALRTWPENAVAQMMRSGHAEQKSSALHEWWVNFYQIFDPVSGSLDHPKVCWSIPPINIHMGFIKPLGYAHIQYWRNKEVLKFILSRAYGKEELPDTITPPSDTKKLVLCILFFLAQILVLVVIALLVWAIVYIWQCDEGTLDCSWNIIQNTWEWLKNSAECVKSWLVTLIPG